MQEDRDFARPLLYDEVSCVRNGFDADIPDSGGDLGDLIEPDEGASASDDQCRHLDPLELEVERFAEVPGVLDERGQDRWIVVRLPTTSAF